MHISAGEIDRTQSVEDLIKHEFERFQELQAHYHPGYSERGFFREITSVYKGAENLKKLGELATIGRKVVPEGKRFTVPISESEEVSVLADYSRAYPFVVAARLEGAASGVYPGSLVLRPEEGFDELVQVGVGAEFRNRYGYAVSLRSILRGGHIAITGARMFFAPPYRKYIMDRRLVRDIPEEAAKDFLQVFREAAWNTVSEPA
jgi:hypothetical protein